MILNKSFIFEILGALRKEQCYVAVSKCMRLFFFFLFRFVSQLFTQRECVKVTFFEIPGIPQKNQCYCIFPGAPRI